MTTAEMITTPAAGVIQVEGEYTPIQITAVERALLMDDLSGLTQDERMSYYYAVCKRLELDPTTKPFAYIAYQSKLILYAKKDCTEQLRRIHNVSCKFVRSELLGNVLIYRYEFWTPDGRRDESLGAIDIAGLNGKELAQAHMKAETRAKRRGTLSICGLGFPDESEITGDNPSIDVRRVQDDLPELRGTAPMQLQGAVPVTPSAETPKPMASPEQMNRINELLTHPVWTANELDAARRSLQGGLTAIQAEGWIIKLDAKIEKYEAQQVVGAE